MNLEEQLSEYRSIGYGAGIVLAMVVLMITVQLPMYLHTRR
jgi:hypothetical protein